MTVLAREGEGMRTSQSRHKMLKVALLFALLTWPCSCVAGIVLLHDYAPIFYKAPHRSAFSDLKNASDVQATLRADLVAHKPSMPEVISYLAQKGVESCAIYNQDKMETFFFLNEIDNYSVYATGDWLVCLTMARDKIINPGNPIDIRGYNLLVEYDYFMTFHFVNNLLVDVQVKKSATGP